MTALLPWWYRWAALAALVASCCAYTWLKTSEHYEARLAVIQAVADLQLRRTKQIEVKQAEVSHEVNQETHSAVAASDAYFAGLRIPHPGQVPSPSSPAGGTQPSAPAEQADTRQCSDADGSADAIQVIALQRFYEGMRAAQK